MQYGLTLVTGPTVEPLSLADLKIQLRVESTVTDEDFLISALIESARGWAETQQHRALITQTWDMTLDGFPSCRELEIPKPPLQSITSITYTDTDGDSQTWASSNYIVDASRHPGRVALAYDKSWPSTRNIINAVTVRFIAGYGNPNDVPSETRSAMRLLIGHLFENRESVVLDPGMVLTEVPLSARYLIGVHALPRVS
jgi:uncharacterized phiE125 gp8 family phage protein